MEREKDYMMSQEIVQNIAQIKFRILQAQEKAGRKKDQIQLCAVSKTQPTELIQVSAQCEIDLFGENRVQELLYHQSADAYGKKPVDLIGHLQRNKVHFVVGAVRMIQSVDSLRILEEIEKHASSHQIIQEVLLQMNIGKEASKTGFLEEEIQQVLEYAQTCSHIAVRGLMAIPPQRDTEKESRKDFAKMYDWFERLKCECGTTAQMKVLSMGMTHDFEQAILEGATLVRIGTGIYGTRMYKK